MRRTQGPGVSGPGSAYLVPAALMTESEKRLFEAKIDDYIDCVQQMVTLADEMRI